MKLESSRRRASRRAAINDQHSSGFQLWKPYSHVYDGLLNFWPYQDLLDRVVDRAQLVAGQRVLDLGAGTGNVTVGLLEAADVTVDAVDLSPDMLAQAAKKIGHRALGDRVRLHVQEAEAFLRAQPDQCYDRIVVVNVLYTIEDPLVLWKEMLRCLAPDGRIVVANPVRAGSRSLIAAHVEHKGWHSLLSPRLVGVAVADLVIDSMAKSGTFSLQGEEPVLRAAVEAGAMVEDAAPAYGGVDVLFTARHPGADGHLEADGPAPQVGRGNRPN